MAWNNDDERTDPNLFAPNAQQPGQNQGQPGGQHGNPRTGGYPQQVTYPQGHPGYPQGQQQGQAPQQGQWNQGGQAHTPQYGVPQQVPGHHQQQPAPAPAPQAAPFVTGAIPVLQAPKVAVEEDAKASRVVFGLSGMAAGGIMGTLLGVLNTQLEGVSVTEGTDFILNFAIWTAFVVGLLAYIFPARFARGLQRIAGNDDD